MIGPKEKKERSVGERLGLKGERCSSTKCAMVRKPYRPGVHGQSRRRGNVSEFGLQIKEKQKFKLSYGVDEKNLRRLFIKSSRVKGSSAKKMLEFLERRLDNVIFRLGFASSRGSARQLIVHGHILVNGRRVRSPGYETRENETVSLRPGSEKKIMISKRLETLKKYTAPPWLFLDADKMQGKIVSHPREAASPFEINLLVESLSK